MPTFAPFAASRRPHPPRCAALAASGAIAIAGLLLGAAAAGEANAARDATSTASDSQRQAQPAADAKRDAAPAKKAEPVTLSVPAGTQRGPDVTLIAGEERTVYEYRQHGRLHMIKVVPKFGRPYYLAPRDPTQGFGDLEQADSLIAQWVLREF